MLKIPCNLDVLAAAFIPNSDDLLMVTKGNITAVKDEEIPALGDNDPTGILWFWRLFRAEQWSFLSASLVARRSPCLSNNALMELWAEEKDKEEFESYSPWTKEEVEEQKRTGIIKWGKKFVDQAGLYLRIHDESHAVTNRGRIWDAWDVTTDSSGRIFYTSCYDGTDVHLLKDTTLLQPSSEKPTPTFIVSQTVGLGFNLCFDATLKVLVTSSRDGAFFVISPPGEGRLDVGEGLPSIRPPGDDHTPGDKTAPWDTVKILEPDGRKASTGHGFYAHGGRITFVDANAQEQLCTTNLLDGKTECSTFAEPINYVTCSGDFCAVFTRASAP
ncbi:unnamed protein product [Durusdinium trenchii]|uniref:Uncharacterized protein n=1 Tax=Durusdinium trenchii TaxID=1381693 RepID=A0ABP0QPJ3_9DINO